MADYIEHLNASVVEDDGQQSEGRGEVLSSFCFQSPNERVQKYRPNDIACSYRT